MEVPVAPWEQGRQVCHVVMWVPSSPREEGVGPEVLPVFYGAALEVGPQRDRQRRGEASRASCVEMVSGPRPELQRKGSEAEELIL